MAKPKKKSPNPRKRKLRGIAKAKKEQTKRTKRAKTMDAKKSAKKTLPPTTKNIRKWEKNKGRIDIQDIDTKK